MKNKLYLFIFTTSFFACTNNNLQTNNNNVEDIDTSDQLDTFQSVIEAQYFSPTDSVSCRELEIEDAIGDGVECFIKKATLNDVYLDIIKNNRVKDVEYMLHLLPLVSCKIDDDLGELMYIDYNYKSQDHLSITLFYPKTQTIIDLKQLGSNVKRGIFHFEG